MTDAIDPALRLARKIADSMYPLREHYWENLHARQGALAAIKQTSELAVALAGREDQWHLAALLRAGKHLGEARHD